MRTESRKAARSFRPAIRQTTSTRRLQVEILLSTLSQTQTGRRSVPSGNSGIRHPAEFRARRKPRLLLRFDGSFLLRFAERQFLAELFQLPPRFTRFEPYGPSTTVLCSTARRKRQLFALAPLANDVAASSRVCRSCSEIRPSLAACCNMTILRCHRRLLRRLKLTCVGQIRHPRKSTPTLVRCRIIGLTLSDSVLFRNSSH